MPRSRTAGQSRLHPCWLAPSTFTRPGLQAQQNRAVLNHQGTRDRLEKIKQSLKLAACGLGQKGALLICQTAERAHPHSTAVQPGSHIPTPGPAPLPCPPPALGSPHAAEGCRDVLLGFPAEQPWDQQEPVSGISGPPCPLQHEAGTPPGILYSRKPPVVLRGAPTSSLSAHRAAG